MTERLKVRVAVFLLLEKDGRYLFSQRKNTGYRDGFYSLPSGHVDPGERPTAAMVREAQEEICLEIREEELEFVHAMFVQDNYADYFFRIRGWKGNPKNAEPEKCEEIRWATLAELGDRVVEEVASAIRNVERGVLFSEVDNMDVIKP